MSSDILDGLAAYAPTPTSIAREWGPREREQHLAAILDGAADAGRQRRLRFVPRAGALRNRAIAPIAASITVLAIAGAIALVADRHDSGGPAVGTGVPAGHRGFGASSTPSLHATANTPRLGAHQWAFRSVSEYDESTTGQGTPQVYAEWIARDGSGQRLTVDHDGTSCDRQAPAEPVTSFASLDQASFDALPHTVGALQAYLTKHVEGSTSREEAIFTAAGDLLRDGDLLASSSLRASFVGVLARLHRTSVHADIDARGRSSVRVDFVDPNQRGSNVQSLYFDSHTFQLLEERSSTGPSTPSDGPSAPYTSTPSGHASTPDQLPVKGSVTVTTIDRIVDTLPTRCGLK